MDIFFVALISYGLVTIINNVRLIVLGNKIISNPSNELVENFTSVLKFTPIDNRPSSWQRLRNVFFAVYNSDAVNRDLKENLYTRLIKKGCNINNVTFKDKNAEERIRKSGEEGERVVAYNLKWISNEYKVLKNIRLKSEIECQEFDNIVIGPNGIFHIETKNYGGENGCKIKIDSSGNWVREYNGRETGMESPEFQLRRHQKVLEENIQKHYGTVEYPISGIVVLSNSKTIVEGVENIDVPVLKADNLCKYIENKEQNKILSLDEINEIYNLLK